MSKPAEIFAWVGTEPGDGIIAAIVNGDRMPLVALDGENAKDMAWLVEKAVAARGRGGASLVRFDYAETINEVRHG